MLQRSVNPHQTGRANSLATTRRFGSLMQNLSLIACLRNATMVGWLLARVDPLISQYNFQRLLGVLVS